MTTLTCRYLVKDCLETLSAEDSTEIQKVFLQHVHAKHPQSWRQLSQQDRSVSIVRVRDRFCREVAEGLKAGPLPRVALAILPVYGPAPLTS